MGDRILVRNQSGLESFIDLDRDMDQATLDRLVAIGDLELVDGSAQPAGEPTPTPVPEPEVQPVPTPEEGWPAGEPTPEAEPTNL